MKTHTAYWIHHTHMFRKDEYECSLCGFCSAKQTTACPRCGTSMRGTKGGSSWIDEMAMFDAIFED